MRRVFINYTVRYDSKKRIVTVPVMIRYPRYIIYILLKNASSYIHYV